VLRCTGLTEKISKTVLLLVMMGILFIPRFFTSVNAEDGELVYRFKEGGPAVALHWELTFPAECHPGDSVDYSIYLNLETSTHTKFYLTVEAIVDQQWVTQYSEDLLSIGNYSAGQEFNWQIAIVVPENAYGNLRLFARTSYSYWGWLNLTNVRSVTYSELEQSYTQLDQSFNELNQSYTTLDSEYENLISTYEPFGKLANTRNLTFIFMLLTAFFAATTAYSLARRSRA
jgi:hypothetical protein